MSSNLLAVGLMTNYQEWLCSRIRPYLGRDVLEAGCGNGNLTHLILQSKQVRKYVGVDHDEALCIQLREKMSSSKTTCNERCVHALNLEDDELVTLGNFDTVVCMNVLEHIADDDQLLSRFFDILCPGGRAIFLVPAFQALHGTIDTAVGHLRRYRRGQLVAKVRQVGFRVTTAHYTNVFGIIAWIWHGKILRLTTHRQADIRAWDRFVPALRWLESLIPPPVGLSVFLVAEKPE